MLRVLNKLNALISETPDIQAHLEIAYGDHEIVVGAPPGIGQTSDTLINFALPFFFGQALNMNE